MSLKSRRLCVTTGHCSQSAVAAIHASAVSISRPIVRRCAQLSELLCHLEVERSHCMTAHLATERVQPPLAPASLVGALQQFGDGLKREHSDAPFNVRAIAVGEWVRVEDV